MTAIAILNAHSDPHLIADTLLSRKDVDLRPDKSVWLPSRGELNTALPGQNRHIRRLGRKSITLPDGAGMLTYAGEAPPAHEFWAEFSERIQTSKTYDDTRRIDRDMLETILHSMTTPKLSILGVLTDETGKQDLFQYGGAICIETQNFGACYFAGTGAEFIRDLVLQADDFWTCVSHRPANQSMTEELAESISSQVLFLESGFPPDNSKSPLSHAFGGYVEWYKIGKSGVKPQKERVEIHITVGAEAAVGRIYLIGTVGDVRAPTSGNNIIVISLTPDDPRITMHRQGDRYVWLLSRLTGEGTIIEPSLPFYDRSEAEQRIDRLSGPVSFKDLGRVYGENAEFHRVRLATASGARVMLDGIVSSDDQQPLAWLGETDGNTEIVLNHPVALSVLDRLERSQPLK